MIRCKCCNTLIPEEEPKLHPLDEMIEEMLRYIGCDKQGQGAYREQAEKLRYESIKWAWDGLMHGPHERIEEYLRKNGHEDWIV